MIRLFFTPKTRASRVVWLLEEAGLDYQLVPITLGAEQQPEAFLRASPLGKVPAIIDGDTPVADSAAICLYVADRYPESRLAPATDDPLRGEYLFWCLYAPSVIEPAMAEKVAGVDPQPGRNGWGSFDLMISALEQRLEGREWIVGNRFTAADIMTGSSVGFLRVFGLLPDSAVLNAYADRCLERPALQKAMSYD